MGYSTAKEKIVPEEGCRNHVGKSEVRTETQGSFAVVRGPPLQEDNSWEALHGDLGETASEFLWMTMLKEISNTLHPVSEKMSQNNEE